MSHRLLLALVAVLALGSAGCGSVEQQAARGGRGLLRAGDLPGWRAVRAEPGIAGLAPDLSGLRLTGQTESPALVHAGDAARAATLVFATAADAAQALARASREGYVAFLEHAFGGAAARSGPGVGYRLRVTRGAEPGSDTAELFLLRRARVVALVELVSGSGFPHGTRERVLELVRSRLSR
jgi:hypothetical protein